MQGYFIKKAQREYRESEFLKELLLSNGRYFLIVVTFR